MASFFAQPSNRLNFLWLTSFKGVITTVSLAGMDILTGDMSGCWIMLYAEGVDLWVAHVGTDPYNPAATAAVKQTWNAFA